ncbi:hypothetical protein Bca4012_084467 [Brassica carinata]
MLMWSMWTTNSHSLLLLLLANTKPSPFPVSILSERHDAPPPEFGGDHSADDVMPGENPVASKVSDGDNKTDVELPDSVSGELGESTNANHQPSSSVVPGGRSSCINQTG